MIERNAFNECRNLHVVMMPHAVNMILEGNFRSMKPYINQQSLPNVDQDAFYKCPIEVVDNCIRSSILLCLWRWVLKKQVKCSIRFIPSNVDKLLDESFSKYSALELTDRYNVI